jgi:hypothetical protein
MSRWQAHPYNKKFFAIALLPVAASKHCFIFEDVGSYGKCSDSSIFRASELRKRIHENALNIPPGKPLDGIFHPPLLYLFVGDEAFGLSMKFLRPYGGMNRLKKKIFNYRLCRARRFIERTFSIPSSTRRNLHTTQNVSTDFVEGLLRTS